jgi:hypothetical protein
MVNNIKPRKTFVYENPFVYEFEYTSLHINTLIVTINNHMH